MKLMFEEVFYIFLGRSKCSDLTDWHVPWWAFWDLANLEVTTCIGTCVLRRKVSVENMIQVLCTQFHKSLFNSVSEHPVWSAIFLWHPEREHNSDTDLWLSYPPRSSVYFLGLVHLQYCDAVPFHVLKYMDLLMSLHLHHGEYIEMLPNHRNMFCMMTQLLIKASSSCYLVLSE